MSKRANRRTEIVIDESGNITIRRGGTLTGEVEGEVKQKALTAFRNLPPDYTPIYIPPWQDQQRFYTELLARQKPVAQQESQPKPEQRPKLVTWRLCVHIVTRKLCVDGVRSIQYTRWYPSGNIPEHWYPVEAHTRPVETIKQLPEGETP